MLKLVNDAAKVKLWHSMSCSSADTMISWLGAIGFTEHATYRDDQDPSVVVHAEWLWPGGGGIMLVRSRRWPCRNGRGCGSWNAKFGSCG